AVTGGYVERTAREALHYLRHALQRRIAGLMPIPVVVGLEVIDVHEKECERTAVAHRLLPEARVVVIERAAVLQTGEAISRHHLAQQSALEKRHAHLPLYALIDEGANSGRDHQLGRVISDVGGRPFGMRQRKAERSDHESVDERRFPEELTAEGARDAEGRQEAERIRMTGDAPVCNSESGRDGDDWKQDPRDRQIQPLVEA